MHLRRPFLPSVLMPAGELDNIESFSHIQHFRLQPHYRRSPRMPSQVEALSFVARVSEATAGAA